MKLLFKTPKIILYLTKELYSSNVIFQVHPFDYYFTRQEDYLLIVSYFVNEDHAHGGLSYSEIYTQVKIPRKPTYAHYQVSASKKYLITEVNRLYSELSEYDIRNTLGVDGGVNV